MYNSTIAGAFQHQIVTFWEKQCLWLRQKSKILMPFLTSHWAPGRRKAVHQKKKMEPSVSLVKFTPNFMVCDLQSFTLLKLHWFVEQPCWSLNNCNMHQKYSPQCKMCLHCILGNSTWFSSILWSQKIIQLHFHFEQNSILQCWTAL